MATTFRVLLNNAAADEDFYTQITSLEVEDNIDLPAAFQLQLPVSRKPGGELTFVDDESFQPFASFAVVINVEGQDPECIFDGFVLSHKLHMETGTTNATLTSGDRTLRAPEPRGEGQGMDRCHRRQGRQHHLR